MPGGLFRWAHNRRVLGVMGAIAALALAAGVPNVALRGLRAVPRALPQSAAALLGLQRPVATLAPLSGAVPAETLTRAARAASRLSGRASFSSSASAASEPDVDVLVVGGGAVGLAVAARLARGGLDVLLLEKNDATGAETTGRNSEVVHAGLYYPVDSLKGQLCRRGVRVLRKYCHARGVDTAWPGKLVVATEEAHLERLEDLYRGSVASGAACTPKWNAEAALEEVAELEALEAGGGSSPSEPSEPASPLSPLDLCTPTESRRKRAIRARALAEGRPSPFASDLPAANRSLGPTLRMVFKDELAVAEPSLKALGALWSPGTGILDSHGLLRALQADLEAAGGTVALLSPVVGGDLTGAAPYLLVGDPLRDALAEEETEDEVIEVGGGARRGGKSAPAVDAPSAQSVGSAPSTSSSSFGSVDANAVSEDTPGVTKVSARAVVFAAGLWSEDLAYRVEGHPPPPEVRYALGRYCSDPTPTPFRRLIYPLPPKEGGGLGVHLTLDLAGRARYGPDVAWAPEGTRPGEIDYSVPADLGSVFEPSVASFYPALPRGTLHPSYAGARPKLGGWPNPDGSRPEKRFFDFDVVLADGSGKPGRSVQGAIYEHAGADGSIADAEPQVGRDGPSRIVALHGIESPGLTACLALADLVAEKLGVDAMPGGWTGPPEARGKGWL